MQIWQIFIAWACFYNSGGKTEGAQKTAICMTFGALAAPVAVGIGAAVIVLAAHVGVLATIPASVYGFASVAGLILLKGLSPVEAIGPTVASIILGAAFGWVSEQIAGKQVDQSDREQRVQRCTCSLGGWRAFGRPRWATP